MSSNVKEVEKNVFSSYFSCVKKYCQFRGRSSRYEYWSFVLINFIIGLILGYVETIKGEPATMSGAYSIFIALPSLAAQTRRLHDINKSGWWLGGLLLMIFVFGVIQGIVEYSGHIINDTISQILVIIALIWTILLLIFYIKKGNAEENRFGLPQE